MMTKRAQCALVLLAMLCQTCGLDLIIDEPPDIAWCVFEGAFYRKIIRFMHSCLAEHSLHD